MKKYLALLLSVLLVLSLIACGDKPADPNPVQPDPPKEDPVTQPGTSSGTTPETTDPVIPEPVLPDPPKEDPVPSPPPPLPALEGDSYWVAYQSEGDQREIVPQGDNILTDLTLWADGTARIREIQDGIRLCSGDDEQNMHWTYESDGTLKLYAASDEDTPYWTGIRTAEGIELNRFGGTYRFRQEPMPEEGALYSPAELQGVWLEIGVEIEGWVDAHMPGNFSSLIFRADQAEDKWTLLASSENGHQYGFDTESRYYGREITLREEPIYFGCGNEVWSVRVGEESKLSKEGYPLEEETYVTLLDQNTLLKQMYFSYENGTIPVVSYQTYKRFLPKAALASGDEIKALLQDTGFRLAGYIDADGVRHDTHPNYSRFSLYLGKTGGYIFAADDTDGNSYRGGGNDWSTGDGGTILMWGEETEQDWYAGAVRIDREAPEIFLWDNRDGILCLEPAADGEWDGYADTMDDIEGRAFAAPENALFVLYNPDYRDFSECVWMRSYTISDSPEARYLLFTAVEDDSYFWLEKDGYCAEDFGTLDAGESVILRMEIPADNGATLQVSTSLGDYYYELSESYLAFNENWNYVTT